MERRRTMQLLLLLLFIGLIILSESHTKHNHFFETDDSPQVPLFRWEASTSLKRIHLHKSDENFYKAIFSSTLEHYRRKRQIRRFKLASRRSKSASKFSKSTTTALPKTIMENPKNDFEIIGNRLSGGSRFSTPKKSPQQQQILGLDLLVVTDYSVYKQFSDDAHGDEYQAENAIYRYYTSILNELSKMYSAQRLGSLRFRVYPVGIVIAKTVKEAPWVLNSYGKNTTLSTTTTSVSSEIWNFTNQSFVASDRKNSRGDYEEEEMYALKTTRIDAYETLRNFQIWIKDNANNLPEHDHAIAMTRLNLERFGDTNAQGIAYVGRICKLGESISLVEDVGVMATVAIAGHELAHSLGAEHDGQNDRTNDCSTAHNYLMVPAVATAVETLPNTFTFSECTIKQIRDHISSSVTKTECLRHSPMDQVGYSGLGETQQPGQIFDVEQQCQQTFGSEYKFCGTNDYYLKQMCRQIWCRNATQGPKSPCVSKPYFPPLSGTTCGHKMWCINGACVEDEKAPSQEGCKFGDRDTSFCLKLVLTEPSKCKTDMFNRFCCESCRQFKRKLYRRLRL